MLSYDIRERTDEYRRSIQGFRTMHLYTELSSHSVPSVTPLMERAKMAHLTCLLPIFKIELVQSFDVIARECDRYKHDALLAEARESLEGISRLWSHPRARPNLGLPYEAVGIRMTQAIHHRCNARGNLEHIWVATVDDGHRERMGREEEHHIATLLFWEFLESSFDVLRDSLGAERDT